MLMSDDKRKKKNAYIETSADLRFCSKIVFFSFPPPPPTTTNRTYLPWAYYVITAERHLCVDFSLERFRLAEQTPGRRWRPSTTTRTYTKTNTITSVRLHSCSERTKTVDLWKINTIIDREHFGLSERRNLGEINEINFKRICLLATGFW